MCDHILQILDPDGLPSTVEEFTAAMDESIPAWQEVRAERGAGYAAPGRASINPHTPVALRHLNRLHLD